MLLCKKIFLINMHWRKLMLYLYMDLTIVYNLLYSNICMSKLIFHRPLPGRSCTYIYSHKHKWKCRKILYILCIFKLKKKKKNLFLYTWPRIYKYNGKLAKLFHLVFHTYTHKIHHSLISSGFAMMMKIFYMFWKYTRRKIFNFSSMDI